LSAQDWVVSELQPTCAANSHMAAVRLALMALAHWKSQLVLGLKIYAV